MRTLIILLITFQSLLAQDPYNHRLHNGEIQAFGHLIYELDSSYLCIGRGFDTLDYIRGMYATEIDKVSGEILHTSKYGVKNRDVTFDRINNVENVDGKPYFIFHVRDTVFLSTYEDREIKMVKKIVSTIPAISHFLYDFQFKDGKFYILTYHSLGEMNSLIFIYDTQNDTTEEIFFYDPEGFMKNPRMNLLENDNFLVTYSLQVGTVNTQYVVEIDGSGNFLWKIKNPISRESYSNAFMQTDSSTYIMGVNNSKDDPSDLDDKRIPYLLNFDYELKEFTQRSNFNIPNNEWHKWNRPVEDIVKSHDGEHFLCVSELFDFPLGDTVWYSSAMVAKVDKNLNLIWKRRYKYIDIEYRYHDFQDIIATSDGNYLCYGTSLDNYWPPPDIPWLSWVIKIDEDGRIIGDTTTSVIDWEQKYFKDEVSIFPNPSSDYITINQDDIEGITYQIYDSRGILEDEIKISSSNSSVVKNISHWENGIKFILIIKQNQQIGHLKLIKQ